MSEDVVDSGALPAETSVGRVAIVVDALDRVVPFYRDVVGCRVDRSDGVARCSALDGRVLVEFHEEPGAPPRPPGAAGLFHLAIRVPDRAALGDALVRIRGGGSSLSGASDHLVSEALYLRDPAGNGVEVYRDRPREAWSRHEDGRVRMDTLPLDLEALVEASSGEPIEVLPPGTDVGHVHLEVTDLDRAVAFYVEGLGFRPSAPEYGGARFLAAGDYHHHVAVNVWHRRHEPRGDHQGLRWFEVVLPDQSARDATVTRLEAAGREVVEAAGLPSATDPDGIAVRLGVDGE